MQPIRMATATWKYLLTETMLELESLGPLVTLNKGERIVHTENWSLNRL